MAARVKRPETFSHTCAHVAPVPCASSMAIRFGSSSVASALVTASEKWLSTSYGVAPPRPHVAVTRSSAACTRAKDNATTVVASTDNGTLGESVRPINAPPPSTTTT